MSIWLPQYEAPEEFNDVTRKFLTTGVVSP